MVTRSVDLTGGQSKTDLLDQDVNNLIQAFNAAKIDYNNINTPFIVPDANGIPNVLFGPRQVNNQRGLFVAKPGINVITAADEDLIFNSNQNVLKVVGKLSMSLGFTLPDAADHQYSTTQAHGFSFAPAYMAFADVATAGAGFRSVVPSQEYSPAAYATLIPSIVKEIWVDATNVKIQVSTQGITGTYNYTFTVYLFQETAN